MIELYHGDCRAFLSHYNGPAFDAVITDPPYSSGGATLSERSASTAEKYTNTKRNCPFPDFAGDQMDARSWLHMMADVFADARVHCHDGAVLVAFCDWRQMPLLTDAVQWAGWQWRGTLVWDKLTSRPQKGRFRQQAEFAVWASNGKLPIDRPVSVLPGVFKAANVQGMQRIHQTQKPEEIMRQICKICLPGGRILDPFAGSGSTLAAAELEGYNSVGVELSEEIAKSAAQRLSVPLKKVGNWNMKEKLKMLVVMMVLLALVFALPVLAEEQDGQEVVLLDLTKLAQAVISLAAGIVSLYLVPWLRSKLTNEQLSKAKSWVQIAVFAAEKLYGAGNGDKKLAYAEEILRKHGIRLDTATLKAMIDAQIKEMENMEPFYLADAKVEMINNPKPETA